MPFAVTLITCLNPIKTIPTFSPTSTESLTSPDDLTPDEKYGDEWWRELPPEIQGAFATLGWNETTWDEEIPPPSEDMDWDELSLEMQEAAELIGYTQTSWDDEEESMSSENIFYDNLNTTNAVVADAGYYEDYDWDELPQEVQAAARILGWDKELWDNDGTAFSDKLSWDQMSVELQEAAAILGYDQISWDSGGDTNLEALLVASGGSYVSNDDDYIFQVGSSKYDISEYQLLFFLASLCFVFLGIIDLLRQNAPFHLLMILAGVFGVASAVFIEENIHLSNSLDCVSVHLFAFEAVALLFKNRMKEYDEKWIRQAVLLADWQFFGGAVLDIVVSNHYSSEKCSLLKLVITHLPL